MRFSSRNFFHNLFVKGDAAFHAAHFGQQPVIKSLSAAQPVAAQIKSHSGHEQQIKIRPAEFPRSLNSARACQNCPGHNFACQVLHPPRDVILRHGVKQGQGDSFSGRQRLPPAPARCPLRPAAAQKTKSWRRSGKKIAPSTARRFSMDSAARAAGGNFFQPRADFRAQRVFGFVGSHFVFVLLCATLTNCARHFSTRSLIFFSTPCSVGS